MIVTEIAAHNHGEVLDTTLDSEVDLDADPDNDLVGDEYVGAGDPTEAIPVFRMDDPDTSPTVADGDESAEDFRFSFDDERS